MAQPIKYKKPRRINVVSVSVVLVLAAGAYALYQWFPLYVKRNEAHRVLQETGSKIAGRPVIYEEDTKVREELRRTMQRQLVEIGIDDPQIETWIEIEGKVVKVGVVYSSYLEWPFDVFPRHERIDQVEHEVVVP
ncbi:hypothetical protein [Paraliomyxa miuraensis]|uniref:hypothetical protein n=1 Tax=Paraliomyxa miuraensis TaxID=376150 RepID=UPI0022508EEE|nr:hypothetical protein [Paraliomyxa miuraensis]MCX4246399.1 hypothetical protein [Paraliomyxa miuraensis]